MLVSVACDLKNCWHGLQPETSHRPPLLNSFIAPWKLYSVKVASSNLSIALFFFFPCFGNRGHPLTSKPSLIGLHGLNAIGIDNFLAWACQLAVLWGRGDNSWGAVHLCLRMCWGHWTPEHGVTPSLQRQHSGVIWTHLPSVLVGKDISELSLSIFFLKERKEKIICPFFFGEDDLVLPLSPQNT